MEKYILFSEVSGSWGLLTIIVCLVGVYFRRAFDGIRFWSRRHGITRLYLLYSNVEPRGDGGVFSYISRRNAEELRDRLEIMDPVMVGFNPMDQRDIFKTLFGIISKARRSGEEVLIDVTSTTDVAQAVALTIALMFRNTRVYTVPSKRPAWYIEGRVGESRFEEWFENARNQPSLEPTEIRLPGYRLEPHSKRDEEEWEVEKRLLVLLRKNGGYADSISDIIRWFGHEAASSTLRNRFSRIVSRLEMKGLVESEKGLKMKAIKLTEFGSIFSEALSEEVAV